MAEWLCRGLQIPVQRFDSASGLQSLACALGRYADSPGTIDFKDAVIGVRQRADYLNKMDP
jgi:hypothetical protein